MKRRFLFCALVLNAVFATAQPWMPSTANGPVKFADALNKYEHSQYSLGDEPANAGNGNEEEEGVHSLYNKWNWYWRGHLDQDGYMVPPVKTLVEWQRYMADIKNSASRTTSAIPSDWVFQGPDVCTHGYSGLGRINVVTFDPVDSNTFYIGAAAGSAWKTTDGGLTWNSLYSNLPTLGVADIKINPLNRNTIYVATGDGDGGDAYSSGVIVSHDGGATWAVTGLNWLPTYYNSAHSLLINPIDTSSMLLASNVGVFKSYNSGLTWTNVFSGSFKQILYNPADTAIVYGTVYIDTTAQIMRSLDGGRTWAYMTAFPVAQRINIAVCPAAPNIVNAIVSNQQSGLQGIYTSLDSGATFTATFLDNDTCGQNLIGYDIGLPTSNCGGQGWYDLCIAVNPANPAQMIVGGINTYYSSDSGHTWQIANQWWSHLSNVSTVHADKHCLAYNALSGALYETCDGGIYKNYGPLTAPWTDLTDGITITEFYRNAVDNRVAFCIGGCQDNGTKMIDTTAALDLTGGDGMQPLINYGDPANIWYCSSQYGNINMTRDAGAHYYNITDTIHSSGGWISPYVLHPSDTGTLLLAYKQVFVSTNNGLSWQPMSPVFDSNDDINTLAIAPSNPNYVYITYFDYTVWQPFIKYTPDFGTTWDTIAAPTSSYISDLVIDPANEKRFWMTISAYGVPKIWQYDLSTNVWTNFTAGLPDVPVQCMIIDTAFKTKYIGTDAAIYYRDTTMGGWTLYNTNLPTVQVDDLHINYTTNEIWAATFGRGMWKSVKAEKPQKVAVSNVVPMPGTIGISPNPNQGNFTLHAIGYSGSHANVKLVSATGETCYQASAIFDGGGNFNVGTTGLAAGFYICEVTCEGRVERIKVVIY